MILIALAGLLGALGVALAAAAAHVSDSVELRAAAELAMVHATAVIALHLVSRHTTVPVLWLLVASVMWAGTTLFTLAVALPAMTEIRLFTNAAPIGGSLTILSWVGVFVAALIETLRGRSDDAL